MAPYRAYYRRGYRTDVYREVSHSNSEDMNDKSNKTHEQDGAGSKVGKSKRSESKRKHNEINGDATSLKNKKKRRLKANKNFSLSLLFACYFI